MLVQSVTLFEEATRTRIAELTDYFLRHGVSDRADAWHRAVVAVGQVVRRQANIMAFSDTFFLLGVSLLVALAAVLLLRRPDRQMEAGSAH